MPLILLELNEINFPFVCKYIDAGELPTLRRVLDEHGYCETTSETIYENIEPWIQWVTAHTGRPFGDHGVFRLGDIVGSGIPQIWEEIEARGLKVGAISPMNAENRLRSPAFFVPDPWTVTGASGSFLLRKLYRAICQAVNDNAEGQVSLESRFWLAAAIVAYGGAGRVGLYTGLLRNLRKAPWRKAILLDRLLADVFLTLWRKERPDFATLFLNGGAHIQHHYMFNSAVYDGKSQNPHWYVDKHYDPVLEVYRIYDDILRDVLALEGAFRVMIATGLHQDPHDQVTFYYRLRDHSVFLVRLGIRFETVLPRMSRDFLIRFGSVEEASQAEQVLNSGRDHRGVPLFEVDNRRDSLFVTLAYPYEIGDGFRCYFRDVEYKGFDQEVAFVAIKNGHHNGTGYFVDTAIQASEISGSVFPLQELWSKVLEAMPGRTGAESRRM